MPSILDSLGATSLAVAVRLALPLAGPSDGVEGDVGWREQALSAVYVPSTVYSLLLLVLQEDVENLPFAKFKSCILTVYCRTKLSMMSHTTICARLCHVLFAMISLSILPGTLLSLIRYYNTDVSGWLRGLASELTS